MLTKGKIQLLNNRLINMNAVLIYQSFCTFTDTLLKRITKDFTPPSFQVDLKAFVDGAAPEEPILTGYLLTFTLALTPIQPS